MKLGDDSGMQGCGPTWRKLNKTHPTVHSSKHHKLTTWALQESARVIPETQPYGPAVVTSSSHTIRHWGIQQLAFKGKNIHWKNQYENYVLVIRICWWCSSCIIEVVVGNVLLVLFQEKGHFFFKKETPSWRNWHCLWEMEAKCNCVTQKHAVASISNRIKRW